MSASRSGFDTFRVTPASHPWRKLHLQNGWVYLSILVAVFILSITTAATGTLWETAQRRTKEIQLLRIGNEFRQAIRLYYQRTPGTVKNYPNQLEELLLDNRQLQTTRYLRKLYSDPITGSPDWGLVRAPEGGIKGVYSKSTHEPLKIHGFRDRDSMFEGGRQYQTWTFVYEPPVVPAPGSK